MAATPNEMPTLPPVTRVLILGYYDGAADGVLQCGDGGPVYRFEWTDATHNPGGCDIRTFELRPLPPDTLDRLAAVLTPYHPALWPVWAPNWSFPTADAKREVERRFDAILAEAGPPAWLLTTEHTVEFDEFTASPVGIPPGVTGG